MVPKTLLSFRWRKLTQEEKKQYYTPEFIAYTSRNQSDRPPRGPFFEFMLKQRDLISEKVKMKQTASYINSMLTDKWRAMNEEERSAYTTEEYRTFQLQKKNKSQVLTAKMSPILNHLSPEHLDLLSNDRFTLFMLEMRTDTKKGHYKTLGKNWRNYGR